MVGWFGLVWSVLWKELHEFRLQMTSPDQDILPRCGGHLSAGQSETLSMIYTPYSSMFVLKVAPEDTTPTERVHPLRSVAGLSDWTKQSSDSVDKQFCLMKLQKANKLRNIGNNI